METRYKVQKFIESNQLLQPGERVLVGVSGGVDSVVLLNILLKSGYPCIVAHCNFHLRGEESNRDEKFVENLAKGYDVPFKKTDFDTIGYAKNNKISIEMAARELRYRWFNDTAREINATSIAVAHHADDSVETVLLNLVRGTGLKGLTGIEMKNGNIVRPLLTCPRTEIEQYAQTNGLQFVFDSTNATNDYNRNKIRNQVIPILSDINPSVRQTIFEDIIRIKGAWKIYNEKIAEIKEQIVTESEGHMYINIPELKLQADVDTVLYEILNAYNFNSDVIEDIAQSLDNTSGLKFSSPTHRLIKDRDVLVIDKLGEKDEVEYLIKEGVNEVSEPIHLVLSTMKIDKNFKISKSSETVHVDADKLRYPLVIRKWQKGDIFHPFGMAQKKKLSDFFVNLKLNLFQKEETWLLLSEDKIVWIIGIRLDNRFRITDKTKNILEIRIKP